LKLLLAQTPRIGEKCRGASRVLHQDPAETD
jgi:hypothetical protein